MKPESRIVKKILAYLNGLDNCKAIKIHGSPYMEAGTPDVLCIYRGAPIWFEVKAASPGKVSDIQRRRLEEWSTAGARCAVVYSLSDVMEVLP